MNLLFIVIVALILAGVVLFFQMKYALNIVIKIFRDNRALNSEKAKSKKDLGFKEKTWHDTFFKPRDYRWHALHFLIRAGIIRFNEEGNLYLSQEDLSKTRIE